MIPRGTQRVPRLDDRRRTEAASRTDYQPKGDVSHRTQADASCFSAAHEPRTARMSDTDTSR